MEIAVQTSILWPVAIYGVSPSTAGGVSLITANKEHKFSCFFFVHWLTMIKMHGGIRCADDTTI